MDSENRLIFLISKVYQKLLNNLQKSFSEKGIDATPIQVAVLFFLQKKDGSSLTELSRGLMIENPTATRLIDRLEKLGFVRRADHPSDRRIYLIYLTKEGDSVANKALPIFKKLSDQMKDAHSEEEIAIFNKVLVGAFNKF